MSTSEKESMKFGRIKTAIYGRTIMILMGFLAQLILLMVGYSWLSSYSFWFYALFLAISVIVLLYMYNAGGNPDMRLSWMLPIAFFPVFGSVFYLTIVSQPG